MSCLLDNPTFKASKSLIDSSYGTRDIRPVIIHKDDVNEVIMRKSSHGICNKIIVKSRVTNNIINDIDIDNIITNKVQDRVCNTNDKIVIIENAITEVLVKLGIKDDVVTEIKKDIKDKIIVE